MSISVGTVRIASAGGGAGTAAEIEQKLEQQKAAKLTAGKPLYWTGTEISNSPGITIGTDTADLATKPGVVDGQQGFTTDNGVQHVWSQALGAWVADSKEGSYLWDDEVARLAEDTTKVLVGSEGLVKATSETWRWNGVTWDQTTHTNLGFQGDWDLTGAGPRQMTIASGIRGGGFIWRITDAGTWNGFTFVGDGSEMIRLLEDEGDDPTFRYDTDPTKWFKAIGVTSSTTDDAANLRQMSGTAKGSVDLGAFTGATIPDASTTKAALQALETTGEAKDSTQDAVLGALGASQGIQDTAITALQGQATQTDAEQGAQDARLDALEALPVPPDPLISADVGNQVVAGGDTGLFVPATAHPDLAAHDALGLATQAELDAEQLLDVKVAAKADAAAVAAGTADRWVDALELKAVLDAIGFAGLFVGSGAAFAALPTTRPDASPLENFDVAVLTADDGANLAGLYGWNGAAWSIVKGIPEPLERVIAEFDSAHANYSQPGLIAPDTLETRRLNDAQETPLADGGTAEIGTGHAVAAGATIAAPTTRPDGTALAIGDRFGLTLATDGNITVTGVAETPTFTGIAWNSHEWVWDGTAFQDFDPELGPLTVAEATATTGADYLEIGAVSAQVLDAWGASRRLHFSAATGAFDADSLMATLPAAIVSLDETATVANMPLGHTTGMAGLVSWSGDGTEGRAFAFLDTHGSQLGLGIWTRVLTGGAWLSWIRFSEDEWIETDVIVGTLTVPLGSKVVLADGKDIGLTVLVGSRTTAVRVVPRSDWSGCNALASLDAGWTVSGQPATGTQEAVFVPNYATQTWEAKITEESLPVTYPGDGGAILAGRENDFFLDDTVGAVPDAEAGKEYAVGIVQANRAVFDGLAPAGKSAVQVLVTHYRAVVDDSGDVTWQETKQASEVAKNVMVFPTGDTTLAFYQDDPAAGVDGSLYVNADAAANYTLPTVVGNNGLRVGISLDWAARAAAAGPPSWITVGAEDIVGGSGTKSLSDVTNDIFPATGNATVWFVADEANTRWVTLAAGEITVSQIIPAFDNAAERDAQSADLVRGTGAGDLLKKLYFHDGTTYEQVG